MVIKILFADIVSLLKLLRFLTQFNIRTDTMAKWNKNRIIRI